MADSERLGPAFDTNTLIRPTQRKLVGVWMDDVDLPTLVLPQVRGELTKRPVVSRSFASSDAWLMMERTPDAPFRWPRLDREQELQALDIRQMFTQPCFPNTPVDNIEDHGDAIAISEALVLGVDLMVTGDFTSIDHHEVNNVARLSLGRNSAVVVTLDSALMRAYPGGELADQLLVNALATVAPESNVRWSVDEAFEDLNRLRRAMLGSRLTDTVAKLAIRWEHSRDLESVVERARLVARESKALEFERLRSSWHRQHAHRPVDSSRRDTADPRDQ